MGEGDAAIKALKAALAEPVLQTCNCRWDGEMQMQQCTLHEAHVDAIKEWAQRAKFAEKKLAALAEQRLTDMEQKMERSIESLKAALTEPVQEPVAWSFEARHIDTAFGPAVSIRHPGREHKYMRNVKPLYTAPPPLTETSAERTLTRLGYTDCGGEFWKPPLGAPAEPVQDPKEFDHGIGADRFKVVRGAFWWHVLIGDSTTEHGKFRSRASAEKMAADLLREFRNGAFVQHEAALAEPVQQGCEHCNQPLYAAVKCRVCGRVTSAEPVQESAICDECGKSKHDGWALYCVKCVEPMFAPPQRPAESVQEPQCNPHPKAPHGFLRNASHNENRYVCECEGWEPYEAGYQAGMEAALRAQS